MSMSYRSVSSQLFQLLMTFNTKNSAIQKVTLSLIAFNIVVLLVSIFTQLPKEQPAQRYHAAACRTAIKTSFNSPVISSHFVDSCFEYLIQDYRQELSRSPPKGFERWLRFASDHQCSFASATYQRIENDLSRFRHRHEACIKKHACKTTDPIITQTMLHHLQRIPFLWKVEIRNGSILAPDGDGYTKAISHFVQDLPDMIFYLNRLDEPRVLRTAPRKKSGLPGINYDPQQAVFGTNIGSSILPLMEQVCKLDLNDMRTHGFFLGPSSFAVTSRLVPIFSSASIHACFADILIPSNYFLEAAENVPWSEQVSPSGDAGWSYKKNIVYWRGSTTGGGSFPHTNYMDFHRHRLVDQLGTNCLKNSSCGMTTDIAFTSIIQCWETECQRLRQYFSPLSRREPLSNSKYYKYLIDIDGNSFSRRFLSFLRFTGSLVLKLGLFEDWATEQTRPEEHFLKLKLDLSDFREKLDWLTSHDEVVRKIAISGQQFAAKRLRYDDMLCYFYRLLLEYHQLFIPSS